MLESINDVNGYLHQFGGALAQKIQTEAEPLFTPGEAWHPRMLQLKRKPFQAQADAIQGAVETLRTHNHVMCIGEMGVGKTLIGAAVPYMMENGHPPRVLVMCPGHLTRKWAREVGETVPGAEARIITSLSDVLAIDPAEPQKSLQVLRGEQGAGEAVLCVAARFQSPPRGSCMPGLRLNCRRSRRRGGER